MRNNSRLLPANTWRRRNNVSSTTNWSDHWSDQLINQTFSLLMGCYQEENEGHQCRAKRKDELTSSIQDIWASKTPGFRCSHELDAQMISNK